MEWWSYAIITMVMFALTNFFVKMAGAQGMDSIFASTLLWLATGAVGVIFIIYGIYTGDFQKNLEKIGKLSILLPVFAGVFLAIGMYTIKKAMSSGPAGPSVAIANSNAVLVAILAYIVLNEKLTLPKIGGMALIIAGIVMLSLW